VSRPRGTPPRVLDADVVDDGAEGGRVADCRAVATDKVRAEEAGAAATEGEDKRLDMRASNASG
jgi:hypothetical protein